MGLAEHALTQIWACGSRQIYVKDCLSSALPVGEAGPEYLGNTCTNH